MRDAAVDYYDRLEKHSERFDQRDYTRENVRHDLTLIVASLAYLGHLKGKSPLLLRNKAWPQLPSL